MKHYESNTGKFYFTPKGLDRFILGYIGLINQLKNVVDSDSDKFFQNVIITSVIDPDKISFRDGLDQNVVKLLVKMKEEDAKTLSRIYVSKKKILYTLENPFTTQLKEMNKDVR